MFLNQFAMKTIRILIVVSLCFMFANNCFAEDYPNIIIHIDIYDTKSRVPVKAQCKLITVFETKKCLPSFMDPTDEYSDTLSFTSHGSFRYIYLHHFKSYHLEVSHPMYGDTILSDKYTDCEPFIRLSIELQKLKKEKKCRGIRNVLEDIKQRNYVFIHSVLTFGDSLRLDSQYVFFEELRRCANEDELKFMMRRDDVQIFALAWKALTLNNPIKGLKCMKERWIGALPPILLYDGCKSVEVDLKKYMIIEFENIIIENDLKIHQSELDEYYEYRRSKFHILRK